MRLQQFTLATSVATLFLASAGASSSFARGGKKEAGSDVPSAINKQFEWENKVVGPKEGLDRRQGRRDPRARCPRGAGAQEQGAREEGEGRQRPRDGDAANDGHREARRADREEAEEGRRAGAAPARRAGQPARRAGREAEQPNGRQQRPGQRARLRRQGLPQARRPAKKTRGRLPQLGSSSGAARCAGFPSRRWRRRACCSRCSGATSPSDGPSTGASTASLTAGRPRAWAAALAPLIIGLFAWLFIEVSGDLDRRSRRAEGVWVPARDAGGAGDRRARGRDSQSRCSPPGSTLALPFLHPRSAIPIVIAAFADIGLCVGIAMLWASRRTRRLREPASRSRTATTAPSISNPRDSRLWVPKTLGIGWTINFAHRLAWPVMIGLVAAPLAMVLLIAVAAR